jgi:hypothetical protein
MTTALEPAAGLAPGASPTLLPADAPVVDVVIPVYNEVRELERSVRKVRCYLDDGFPFTARVTIADNASTDGTWEVAARLAAQVPGVRAVRLAEKGRGRALRTAWGSSDAAVLAYMDVDLATDLDAVLPLVAPLVSGHSDVAIGTRLARGARVLRGAKREVISRVYNLVLRLALHNGFTDAQCGFKALRADAAHALLPLVEDNAWFFDTELLALAEHNGMRIHEVPVDWTDDPDSRVDITSTALADLRGTWRLWRHFRQGGGRVDGGRVRRGAPTSTALFAGVGTLSTVAYVAFLVGLQPTLGTLTANAVALSVCAAGNATAHRLTRSGVVEAESAADRLRLWLAGLVLSSAALAAVGACTSSLWPAVLAVLATGALVSTARFVALRERMYRSHLDADGA